ncbi:hypothetical protein C1X21_28980 [Pseudomonas sp. FW305-3-2-15-A-LB2]|nr:hypothetical protein C1X21_28980 [Pseudomonas sp. FW305-3-2-15-A-LB2]PMV43568.1 hypothetical protein C1X18_28275 [Pseudomonas sp. FW305-3-2-15-C-LB1]PMV46848.1 hypothetical protein C1X19_29535 [Pseudomonas sp. GW460-4]
MKNFIKLTTASALALSMCCAFAEKNNFNVENSFTIDAAPICVPQSTASFKYGTADVENLIYNTDMQELQINIANCPVGQKIHIKQASATNLVRPGPYALPETVLLATATTGPEKGRNLIGVAYFVNNDSDQPILSVDGARFEIETENSFLLSALLTSSEHYDLDQPITQVPAGDYTIETPLVITLI